MMDNLFDELYLNVFQNLSVYDLKNCSLVCKRLNREVRKFKASELIIGNDEGAIDVWFYTNKSPNFNYCLFDDNLRFLETNLINLQQLRSLRVRITKQSKKFKLQSLNAFQRLVQLEINISDYIGKDILELNNLEILSIESTDSTFTQVIAPKLFALYLNYFYSSLEKVFSCVDFKYPETVVYFETGGCIRGLELFKNVQHFKTAYTFPDNIFNIFPEIKAIHFMCIQEFNSLNYSHLIDNINQLRSKAKYFGKEDLCLYMYGLKCDGTIPSLEEFDSSGSLPALQLKKYDLLEDNLSWMKEISYGEIKDHNLPDNWFDKFANVNIFIANKIDHQSDLMKILRNLKNLNLLTIYAYDKETHLEYDLDQQFFDYLNTIETLTRLFIYSHKEINLDFVHKISWLNYFVAEQNMSVAEVLMCFMRLRHLKTVQGSKLIANKKDGYLHLDCKKMKKKFKLAKLAKYHAELL